MGHLTNIFLALAVVCLIGSSAGKPVKRTKVVYHLPEEYERGFSEGMVSEVADYDASTPGTFSLSPCDDSDADCRLNYSEGASESYFGGDSSSAMPF